MTAPELLPCPFCGEKMPPHDDTSWVRCYGCGAETGWRPTGDEAAAAWNRRADLHDATKAQLAECEARLRKAVAALRFYADKEAYETQYERLPCDCCTDIFEPINDDKGEKARAVLAEIEKGGV